MYIVSEVFVLYSVYLFDDATCSSVGWYHSEATSLASIGDLLQPLLPLLTPSFFFKCHLSNKQPSNAHSHEENPLYVYNKTVYKHCVLLQEHGMYSYDKVLLLIGTWI